MASSPSSFSAPFSTSPRRIDAHQVRLQDINLEEEEGNDGLFVDSFYGGASAQESLAPRRQLVERGGLSLVERMKRSRHIIASKRQNRRQHRQEVQDALFRNTNLKRDIELHEEEEEEEDDEELPQETLDFSLQTSFPSTSASRRAKWRHPFFRGHTSKTKLDSSFLPKVALSKLQPRPAYGVDRPYLKPKKDRQPPLGTPEPYRDDPQDEAPHDVKLDSSFLTDENGNRASKRHRLSCLVVGLLVGLLFVVLPITVSHKRRRGGQDQPMGPESTTAPSPNWESDLQTAGGTANSTVMDPVAILQSRLGITDAQEHSVASALEWLASEPDLDDRTTDELSERFAVANLYYSTGGAAKWGHTLGFLSRSLSVCDWNDGLRGVFCDHGDKVTQLLLFQNSLEGFIPSSLSRLTELTILRMFENSLTSSIPPELCTSLTRLTNLELHHNTLTGQITTYIGNLTNMRGLSFSSNLLRGTIPSEFGQLAQLQALYISDNKLTGQIPSELGGMAKMGSLDLSQNRLIGSIPSTFGNMDMMFDLNLEGNQCTGTIPSEFGQLSRLELLNIGYNRLSGGIPTELTSLSFLQKLDLQQNLLAGLIPAEFWSTTALRIMSFLGNINIWGSIPTEIGNLNNLQALRLAATEINGVVPTEIGLATSLKDIQLSFVAITGHLPTQVGLLSALTSLDVSSTSLTGEIPTELGRLPDLEILKLFNTHMTGDLDSLFCNQGTGPSDMQADCGGANSNVQCSCCTHCFVR